MDHPAEAGVEKLFSAATKNCVLEHVTSMAHVEERHAAVLGKMMALVPKLAKQEGCRPYPEGGFRIVCNTGADGGQEVPHVHFHVIGGPRPWLKG